MHRPGFTLIELSIVLVIIGLIVGGILVGQDLIKAAEVRAQVSQIEKYNTAVNTFKAKFGGLPGDLAISAASQFGFVTTNCTGTQGRRDGNGLLDSQASPFIYNQTYGETGIFWEDLSSAAAGSLIEGQFPNSGAPTIDGNTAVSLTTTPGTTFIGDYLPQAKIGHGNFIYVYESSGYNWYGMSTITSVSTGLPISNGKIPVIQAYDIDKKVDDGLPTTGAVVTLFINSSSTTLQSPTNATSDTTTTCYNTTSNTYSISSYANYGAGGNCALSFRFQ